MLEVPEIFEWPVSLQWANCFSYTREMMFSKTVWIRWRVSKILKLKYGEKIIMSSHVSVIFHSYDNLFKKKNKFLLILHPKCDGLLSFFPNMNFWNAFLLQIQLKSKSVPLRNPEQLIVLLFSPPSLLLIFTIYLAVMRLNLFMIICWRASYRFKESNSFKLRRTLS